MTPFSEAIRDPGFWGGLVTIALVAFFIGRFIDGPPKENVWLVSYGATTTRLEKHYDGKGTFTLNQKKRPTYRELRLAVCKSLNEIYPGTSLDQIYSLSVTELGRE